MQGMRWLVGPIMLVALFAPAHSANAGGFWRFNISVDGKPAFTGGIGVFGEYSPIDHLESSVREGVVQLGSDSFLDETITGDITLTGDVVFRDPEHPELHVKRLRLIYKPDSTRSMKGASVAGGFYDWRLHPEDADLIVAHYRGRAAVVPDERPMAPTRKNGDDVRTGADIPLVKYVGLGVTAAVVALAMICYSVGKFRG